MTLAATSAQRLLPGRPVPQFVEQALFLVMVWAGFSVAILLITFGVSLFREIEISGWSMGSSAARWFVFAIACYLAYSVLPLHVTHGQTRRDFAVRFMVFVPLYAALAAVLVVITFYIEGAVYGLMGWPHVIENAAFHRDVFSGPLALLETWLIASVWVAAGAMIAAGWYRNSWLGSVLTLLAVLISVLSATTLGDRGTPFAAVGGRLGIEGSIPLAIVGHIVFLAVIYVVFWFVVRDTPIHSKAEDA